MPVLALAMLTSPFAYTQRTQAAITEAQGGVPATNQILPALYIQNIFFKALIGTYGKPDAEKIAIVRAAEARLIQFISQPRYIQEIANADDLEKVKELYQPEYFNLQDELATSAKTAPPPYIIMTGTTLEGREAIDKEVETAGVRYVSVAKLVGSIPGSAQYPVLNTLYKLLQNSQSIKVLLDQTPDSARLWIAHQVEKLITNKLKMVDSIGDKMAESGSFKFKTATQQRFFQLALTNYFRGLTPDMKMNMIATFFDHLDLKTDRERFELMLLDAGPQFQKLLQSTARDPGLSEDFRAMLKRLEQGTKAAPWRLIEPVINAIQPREFTFTKIKHKAVAAGSMAQVHKAEITYRDGHKAEVALRILKPNIAAAVATDTIAFSAVADAIDTDPFLAEFHFPKFRPHVKEFEVMTTTELSLPTMVKANMTGQKVYQRILKTDSGGVQVRVPDLTALGDQTRVSIQPWVEGISFEKYMEENPAEARQVVEQLAKMWLNEALFGGGFYHADLHHGNLRVSKDNGKTVLNILDFGMAGTIDKKLQNQFLAFGALVESRNADVMAKIVWELSDEATNTISQAQLRDLFQKELDRQEAAGIHSAPFHTWAALALNAGIGFPPELAFLGRGAAYVFGMLEQQKSSVTMPKLIKEIILSHPMRALEVMNSTPTITKSEWMHALYDQAQNYREKTKAAAAALEASTPASRAGFCSDAFLK